MIEKLKFSQSCLVFLQPVYIYANIYRLFVAQMEWNDGAIKSDIYLNNLFRLRIKIPNVYLDFLLNKHGLF